MSVSHPHKSVCPAQIDCGGTTTVTISFDARAAETCPTDIALVLDRSSSMCPPRLCRAKAAVKQLIDRIADPGHLGLVSFADDARRDVPLTTDKARLHTAVENLQYGGATNHHAAFAAAEQLLSHSEKRKILVLFTDGAATVGPNPDPVAERLKAAGVEIYCIGLATDPSPLRRWASAPVEEHVAVTDDCAQLEPIFCRIAGRVVLAGGREVVLEETLCPDFQIVNAYPPTHGTVHVTGPRTLRWSMEAVGLTPEGETASLSFAIRHTGTRGGTKEVNESLLYTDADGNTLNFPSPVLRVDCSGGVLYPEPCPRPTAFRVEACQDAVHVVLADTPLPSPGRIVQVDATIRHVCPGRPVAAAILLTEVDECGTEHHRGLRTIHIPPQGGEGCRDVMLRCVRFVVPEALNPEGENSLCRPRQFTARVMANYTDTDFACCNAGTVDL